MGPDDPSYPDDEYEIIYPDGMQDLIQIDAHNYPASLRFSSNFGGFCSGTMVTPRVLLTAAHCINDGWDGINNPDYSSSWIPLTDSVPDEQGESTITYYRV